MSLKEYRFKFYINARHTVKFNDSKSKIHPHTWEIVLYMTKKSEGLVQFTQIEDYIKFYFSMYEGNLLNEIPPFNIVEPTLENIGEAVYEQIKRILNSNGWDLRKLEVSENPSRTYIVSDKDEAHEKELESATLIRFKGLKKDIFNHAKAFSFKKSHLKKEIEQETKNADAPAVPLDNSVSIVEEATVATQDITINSEITDSSSIKELTPVEKVTTPQQATTASEVVLPAKRNIFLHFKFLLLSIAVIVVMDILTILWITQTGIYPWGSDSWYHVFKGHFLYNQILSGNYFPLYTDIWYNGIQPLRYWAPLPHYILATIEMLTKGNFGLSYNIYLMLIFLVGGFGWILWGIKTQRKYLGLILAILWFFLPDNLRVMFSEGNMSRVTVTTIFPYLMLGVWSYLETRKQKAIIFVSLCMSVITVCHAMITAMVGLTLFLFVSLYALAEKKIRPSIEVLIAAVLGMLLSGTWLYPSVIGDVMSLNQTELVDMLTYPALESLNPILRLTLPDSFYFGLSIFIITILGILLGDKKSKVGFSITFLIFFGTTKTLVPIIQKLPMGQLFWMMRFTPLALGAFFIGLLLWKKLRKEALIFILIALIIDSAVSFKFLCHDSRMPANVVKALKPAINISTQRIALLDQSSFGAFPSFYIYYNENNKRVKQVFGAGWQGAKTSQNLIWLNSAFDKECFAFLFDRFLEHGADTLVVKKDLVKNTDEFFKKAAEAGFEKKAETDLCVTLKLPVNYRFGTKVQYTGLAIGNYASNIPYLFPQFQLADSNACIDDFTEDELKNYKVIYLSGFKYKDKVKAENMVKRLSQSGIKFLIDLTGADSDIYSTRSNFLGVISQPVNFIGKYPVLKLPNTNVELGNFPDTYPDWRTLYLENLDNVYGKAELEGQELSFLGTKINENINFIGFNIPFFALETKDNDAIKLIESIIGIKAHQMPAREIVRIYESTDKNIIDIKAEKEGIVTGVACLDTLQSLKGDYAPVHNLVLMKGKELKLKVCYPHFSSGFALSCIGFIGIILFNIFLILSRKQLRINMFKIKAGKNV